MVDVGEGCLGLCNDDFVYFKSETESGSSSFFRNYNLCFQCTNCLLNLDIDLKLNFPDIE